MLSYWEYLCHFVGCKVCHVGLYLIVGEHGVDIIGIAVHLYHILLAWGFDSLNLGTLRRLEILKLNDAAVVVERRTGDARQHKVGTTGRQVLLNGKCIAVAKITAQDLKEGTTHEVLVDLVECLCGKLSEVFLEIVIEKRFEHKVFNKNPVCWNEKLCPTTYLIQLIELNNRAPFTTKR